MHNSVKLLGSAPYKTEPWSSRTFNQKFLKFNDENVCLPGLIFSFATRCRPFFLESWTTTLWESWGYFSDPLNPSTFVRAGYRTSTGTGSSTFATGGSRWNAFLSANFFNEFCTIEWSRRNSVRFRPFGGQFHQHFKTGVPNRNV